MSESATQRRAKMAEAITAHRRGGSRDPVVFASGDDEAALVEYVDREITVQVDAAQQERLDDLLEAFPVFKIAQPATRKAQDGEVHLSALTDPKHCSDFLDRLFLDVFDQRDSYAVRVTDA